MTKKIIKHTYEYLVFKQPTCRVREFICIVDFVIQAIKKHSTLRNDMQGTQRTQAQHLSFRLFEFAYLLVDVFSPVFFSNRLEFNKMRASSLSLFNRIEEKY